MKILQIGKFYPPYFYGGIETVSYNLHQALQTMKDVKADFLGFLPKKYKKDIQIDDHIYLCKTNIDKFSAQISWSFLKKYKTVKDSYDIIFVNMPHPVANLAMWLFPPKKAKIVLYWHSDIIKQKKILFFYKPFLVNLIKKSNAIVAPTSIHLDESDFNTYFINKKYVLPFVLNFKTKRTEYKLDENGKKVVFACGRLIYYKGFDILIDAAKKINNDAVIHISGEGPLKEFLLKQINDNKLSDKVKLLGRLSYEDLQTEYKNCYLYCFPSTERSEMMGMVQYEALSYGKPIVSTNIPRSGAPALNIENVSGFHVPVRDSILLAKKINTILNDKTLYAVLCNGAVELSEKYNSKDNIEQYYNFFYKIINK